MCSIWLPTVAEGRRGYFTVLWIETSSIHCTQYLTVLRVFDNIQNLIRVFPYGCTRVFQYRYRWILSNTAKYYIGTRLKDILNSLKDFIPPSLPCQLLNDLWEFFNMSTLSLVFFLLLHRFGKLPRPYFWQNSAESALRVVRKLWRPGHHSCQGNWRIRVGLSRRRRVCLLRPVPFLI